MTMETAGVDRCPTCGAAVRFGDPWCTLCYADLRPPAPPPSQPAPPPPADPLTDPLTDPLVDPLTAAPYLSRPPGPDPLSAPLEAVAGPSWPCSSCGAVNPMARDICAACGLHFLAGLQGGPLLELPVVGDITRFGRAQRFAIAGGVVLVVLLLTALLGLIFG